MKKWKKIWKEWENYLEKFKCVFRACSIFCINSLYCYSQGTVDSGNLAAAGSAIPTASILRMPGHSPRGNRLDRVQTHSVIELRSPVWEDPRRHGVLRRECPWAEAVAAAMEIVKASHGHPAGEWWRGRPAEGICLTDRHRLAGECWTDRREWVVGLVHSLVGSWAISRRWWLARRRRCWARPICDSWSMRFRYGSMSGI